MAAKLTLTIFAVLAASQVQGSCLPCNPAPSCSGPGSVTVVPSSGCSEGVGYAGGYYGKSLYYPAPSYLPGPSDCSVPPVYVPPPVFPNLPTIHAPKPLTIPLHVPSVIPVGKVCVCKAIQIQPSVVPSPKPVYTCGCSKDVVIPAPSNPCPCAPTSHCPC